MTIKQPVKNTMARIGLNWEEFEGTENDKVTIDNRFGGGSCETTPLVRRCIETIYSISNAYEDDDYKVTIDDFDRLRHFVLDVDSNAYMVCID